jgi:glutamate synthase (NADPH/NADH) small chain
MPQERRRVVAPRQRVRSFQEVHLGLSRIEALEDAKIFLERERSAKGDGCPLGTDFFAVIRAVAKGELSLALGKLLEADPFPAVTSRLCDDPYSETQVFNRKAARISLRDIERFVADNTRLKKRAEELRPRQKVAVVGSGPSGLTAAHFLKRAGFRVTVLESSHVLGGTLSYAYPEFRLPVKALALSIARMKSSGIEFATNSLFGRDVDVQGIFDQGYAAVLLACGAGIPKALGIPGEEAAGVISVDEMLKWRHWMKAGIEPYSTPFDVGRKVVIAGRGEKAFDAARILVRMGREVTIVASASEADMGADADMIREALEEGVKVKTYVQPKAVQKDHAGCAKALVCEHLSLKPDGETVVEEDSEFYFDADTILTAAGGVPDTLFLRQTADLKLGPVGEIWVKPGMSAETSVNGVFACGHLVDPQASFVDVVNSAKRAVGEIDKFLTT